MEGTVRGKQPPGLLKKLLWRELSSSMRQTSRSRPEKIFNKIPGRLGFKLEYLVPQTVLEEGHVFLGFTKDGQFVLSYSLQLEADENTAHPVYAYRLQWWLFVPHQPFKKVSEVRLFGGEEIVQDLFIAICEWPHDKTKILVYGNSVQHSGDDCQQCYVTITAVPPLQHCSDCQDAKKQQTAEQSPANEDSSNDTDSPACCLAHSLTVNTKYELTPPNPPFVPLLYLRFDGVAIFNTGDSIIALDVRLANEKSSLEHDSHCVHDRNISSQISNNCNICGCIHYPGVHGGITSPLVTENGQTCTASANSSQSDIDIYQFHSPSSCVEEPVILIRGSTTPSNIQSPPMLDHVYASPPPSNKPLSPGAANAERIVLKHSPPQQTEFLSLASSQDFTDPFPSCSYDNFVSFAAECTDVTPPPPPSSTKSSNGAERNGFIHESDKENMPSTLFPVSSYSNGGLSVNSTTNGIVASSIQTDFCNCDCDIQSGKPCTCNSKTATASTVQKLMTSPQSVLQSSSGYKFSSSQSSSQDSDVKTNGITGASQRTFFSPTITSSSGSGVSRSSDSLVFYLDNSQSVTLVVRKFIILDEQNESLTLDLEDDNEIAYHIMLPLTVLGSQEKPLTALKQTQTGKVQGDVVIKQLTLDIEHYLGEIIRSQVEWGPRFIDVTDYDVQIIDVCPCRHSVIGKVYVWIHARHDHGPLFLARKRRGPISLFKTSVVFEWSIETGACYTVFVEDLKEVDETQWRSRFRVCQVVQQKEVGYLRRLAYIPQSYNRAVHVLTNQAVFTGRSTLMLLDPQHYVAIIL